VACSIPSGAAAGPRAGDHRAAQGAVARSARFVMRKLRVRGSLVTASGQPGRKAVDGKGVCDEGKDRCASDVFTEAHSYCRIACRIAVSEGSRSSAHCAACAFEQCTLSRANRQMRQAVRTMKAAFSASSVRRNARYLWIGGKVRTFPMIL
jgi:hypothetical protein